MAIRYSKVSAKYGNKKVSYGGDTFDSIKERDRWLQLRLLERAGKVQELRRQVPYTLIPAQRDNDGKIIERECRYIADFDYIDEHREHIVEDTKGFRTPEYIIKRKLMLFMHGIRIKEI